MEQRAQWEWVAGTGGMDPCPMQCTMHSCIDESRMWAGPDGVSQPMLLQLYLAVSPRLAKRRQLPVSLAWQAGWPLPLALPVGQVVLAKHPHHRLAI